MNRFYGAVGFVTTVETSPGVFEEIESEKSYYGDILANNRRLDRSEFVNDDIVTSNRISVVADAYALQNFFAIRYVVWMGQRWKATQAEVAPPRIILSLGEVYNG